MKKERIKWAEPLRSGKKAANWRPKEGEIVEGTVRLIYKSKSLDGDERQSYLIDLFKKVKLTTSEGLKAVESIWLPNHRMLEIILKEAEVREGEPIRVTCLAEGVEGRKGKRGKAYLYAVQLAEDRVPF